MDDGVGYPAVGCISGGQPGSCRGLSCSNVWWRSNVWDVNAASAFSGSWLVLVIAIIFAAPVGDFLAKKSRFMERNRRTLRYALAVPVFIVCIAKCAVSAYNPFIYFNF